MRPQKLQIQGLQSTRENYRCQVKHQLVPELCPAVNNSYEKSIYILHNGKSHKIYNKRIFVRSSIFISGSKDPRTAHLYHKSAPTAHLATNPPTILPPSRGRPTWTPPAIPHQNHTFANHHLQFFMLSPTI